MSAAHKTISRQFPGDDELLVLANLTRRVSIAIHDQSELRRDHTTGQTQPARRLAFKHRKNPSQIVICE
jgi:hypothetical protein